MCSASVAALDFNSRNCNKLRRDAQTSAVSDGEGGYRARYSMLSSLIHCGGKLGEAESGEAKFGEARIGGEAGRAAEVKAGGEAEASGTSEAADADGSECGTGEKGDPGCGWGAAEAQEGCGQVRVEVGGSVPELISELLRSILPSTYSSQKTFLLFPTHPSRLLDLFFQSPHLRLRRPSQQLLRDFQRETLELAIIPQGLKCSA